MTFEWRPDERPFFLVLEVYDHDTSYGTHDCMGMVMVPLASNIAYRKRAWFRLGRGSPG